VFSFGASYSVRIISMLFSSNWNVKAVTHLHTVLVLSVMCTIVSCSHGVIVHGILGMYFE
jgi:hypothetical protein